MADITSRTIGYICPHCRNSVIAARSTFQLTASASCEIPCPCGKSSLNIEYLLDRFRITAPCYVGEEGAVFAAMERLEKATDHLAQEKDKQSEEPDTFLNNLVMEEVLAELKDIAQRDGISCECGSHQWRLEVHYASVELICAQCGSAMRINAGTMDDLNELCCHPKLTIRSSPA